MVSPMPMPASDLERCLLLSRADPAKTRPGSLQPCCPRGGLYHREKLPDALAGQLFEQSSDSLPKPTPLPWEHL
jgi:hypothetical protein